VTDTDSTALTLYESAGSDRLSLFLTPKGDGALMFSNANSEPRMVLAAGPDDAARDRLAVCLMVPPDGPPSLDLLDRDERSIWSSAD